MVGGPQGRKDRNIKTDGATQSLNIQQNFKRAVSKLGVNMEEREFEPEFKPLPPNASTTLLLPDMTVNDRKML